VIAFPNCKINIGLNVVSKREDGYHDIETVFYPLNFSDALEIIQGDSNEFNVTGLSDVDSQNNLCIKAYDLIKKDFPGLPYIKMHLHKSIPIGAGLGGGSSDAAFTLKILNEKFSLGLSEDQLRNYALELGSDCPFFLHNKPCLAKGRGEQLEPIDFNLSSYTIILVNPAIHVNTTWAFSNIKPVAHKKSIQEVITQPIDTWKHDLVNDFEALVFETYPGTKRIKEILYERKALYASLSGSGSTVYGIFDKAVSIDHEFPADYFTRIINLK
jgi:4-diphosphocytidyl-2-C-methyl-D-erythritol kinase